MKGIQTPRKNFPHYSDPGKRRLKDSQPKNRKFAEKRLSNLFSDVSSESTKDPVDSAPTREIYEVISDCDAESVVDRSSLNLLASPEEFSLVDPSPISTITNVDGNMDDSEAVCSLRAEVIELKKLILPNDVLEGRSWIDETITMKFRVVFLFFLLWFVLTLIMVFFSSGEEVSYIGPLPT